MTRKSCFGSIYKYELLKILKNKVAVITFLILFVYAFVQGQFEISGGVDLEDMEAYSMINGREIDDELLNELRAVTDEAGNLIDDKYVAYKHLNAWVLEVLDVLGRGASIRDLNAEKLYEDRVYGIREAQEALQLSEGEILYWSEKEASLDKPFRYHDTMISGGVLEGTTNYMIMSVLLIAVSLSMVFAMETQRKTDPMIRASIHGGRELYYAKILAGMTYVMSCVILLLLTFYAYIGIVWGYDGMDSLIQVYYPLAELNITMWQLAGILIMLILSGSILISAFALFISNATRNGLAAMTILIVVHGGLFAIATSIPLDMRVLSQCLSLFPPTLVSSRLVYEFRLVKVGSYYLCYQAAPVLYGILTVVFLALGYVMYDRHEIKSN